SGNVAPAVDPSTAGRTPLTLARPFLIGTLGAWFLMSLAAALAWQRGDQATVAWLIWPASVAGAVIAERLMRVFDSYRQVNRELRELLQALREATSRQMELTATLSKV